MIRLEWVPASVDYFTDWFIGIKYRKTYEKQIKIEKVGVNYFKIRYLDKEFHIFNTDGMYNTDFYSFDEIFDFSPLNKKEFLPNVFMINAFENMTRNGLRSNLNYLDKNITVIADSGGFQIATARVNFIDPLDIAKIYNLEVDYGMTLDVPMILSDIGSKAKKLFKRAIKVQNNNSKIIQANLNDNVKLINIFHSFNLGLEGYIDYIEGLDEVDTDYCSIAGLYFYNLIESTYILLYLLKNYIKGRYNKVHILGLSSSKAFLIFSYIAKRLGDEYDILLTMDSTRQLMLAKARRFIIRPQLNSIPKEIAFSKTDMDKYKLNFTYNLPCSCPFCSVFNFPDYLPETYFIHLYFHNIYIINEFKNFIYNFVINSNKSEILEYIKQTLPKNLFPYMKQALDLVDMIVDKGMTDKAFQEAKTKYKWYFTKSFKSYKDNSLSEEMEEEFDFSNPEDRYNHYNSVLDMFEDYYSGVKIKSILNKTKTNINIGGNVSISKKRKVKKKKKVKKK